MGSKTNRIVGFIEKYLEVQSFGEELRTIQENCEIFI